MSETINGARIVLETLHRLGVTDMFGYPGGALLPPRTRSGSRS